MEQINGKLLSWASILENEARDQAIQTAGLPFVKPHLALMPDAHWGMGSTVGSVIPTVGAVIPAAVGVDIGCVDGDTEYLSPTGWRHIDEYDGGPVMQYEPDTGTGRFVDPLAYIVKDCPEFVRLRTKYGIDQALSPDHRVLVWRIVGRDRREVRTVITAAEFEAEHGRLVQGFKARFETTFVPVLTTKLELSDDQIRVQVMVHADAHLDRGRVAVVRLKKQRKIERAHRLLQDAGITWTEHVSDDVTTIRFEPPTPTKTYGVGWWQASSDQLGVIADEVLHWDGHGADRVFFTRDQDSADFIHYVFTATGHRSVLRRDEDSDGYVDYRVFAHTNTRVSMGGAPKTPITRMPSSDGKAYCFTVPSGFWVMRRNGNVAMTGNCGMSAVRTNLTLGELPDLPPLSVLRHGIQEAIPVSMGGYRTELSDTAAKRVRGLEDAAQLDGVDPDRFAGNWRLQLGTLGSGNHFIEVCVDSDVDQYLWVFLHSGSRGVGNRIAQHHIKVAKRQCERWWIDLPNPDLAYLPEGDTEFWNYIRDLRWAQRFAAENRAEMVDRVVDCIREWSGFGYTLATGETITCHHNYTTQERHMGRDVWITRKGAISAQTGQLGLIPGSMGRCSYVVTGRGYAPSFNSAPHGAGRAMSRGKARNQITPDQLTEAMAGIEWRDDIADALLDEAPDAYKPIDQIMADARDLVTVETTLTQLLNVKGT